MSEIVDANYVNVGQSRCSPKQIRVTDEKIIKANVIQCSINRNRNLPQFYLLGDRKKPDAAFLLRRHAGARHVLKIISRIDNINILLERGSAETAAKSRKKLTTIL